MKTDWRRNDYEGRALRRSIKRILELVEEAGDPEKINAYYRTLGFLIQTKATLGKIERELEIEKRLDKLEAQLGKEQK